MVQEATCAEPSQRWQSCFFGAVFVPSARGLERRMGLATGYVLEVVVRVKGVWELLE